MFNKGAEAGCRVTYLGNDRLDKFGQIRVHKVDDDAHALGLARVQCALNKTRHVLLQHGLDIAAFLLVCREDGLAAQEPALLRTVPVELDGVLVVAVDDIFGLEDDTEGLENGHSAAAVVVSAGRGEYAR